jgi:hypothetical protein
MNNQAKQYVAATTDNTSYGKQDTDKFKGAYIYTYNDADNVADCIQENPHIMVLHNGEFYLMLGREDWISTDLPDLEKKLADWAKSEGYF